MRKRLTRDAAFRQARSHLLKALWDARGRDYDGQDGRYIVPQIHWPLHDLHGYLLDASSLLRDDAEMAPTLNHWRLKEPHPGVPQ